MNGRFRLYTDTDLKGQLVDGLIARGWDVLRGIDAYPEGTRDAVHFERAAQEGRVLVTYDLDHLHIALEWVSRGRAFPGLVTFPPGYPIRHLTPPGE